MKSCLFIYAIPFIIIFGNCNSISGDEELIQALSKDALTMQYVNAAVAENNIVLSTHFNLNYKPDFTQHLKVAKDSSEYYEILFNEYKQIGYQDPRDYVQKLNELVRAGKALLLKYPELAKKKNPTEIINKASNGKLKYSVNPFDRINKSN